jgi:hypothetical protein
MNTSYPVAAHLFFTDSKGIGSVVEVTASSLYEAAVLAMA